MLSLYTLFEPREQCIPAQVSSAKQINSDDSDSRASYLILSWAARSRRSIQPVPFKRSRRLTATHQLCWFRRAPLHKNSWIISPDMDLDPWPPTVIQNHFANAIHQMGSEMLGGGEWKLFHREQQIIHFANTDLREHPLMLSRALETL